MTRVTRVIFFSEQVLIVCGHCYLDFLFMIENLQLEALLTSVPTIALDLPYFGTIDFTKWVAAIGLFLTLTIVFWFIRAVALGYLHRLSKKTKTDIDDVAIEAVQGIRAWVYTVAALFLSLQFFNVPELLDKVLISVFLFSVVWQLIEVSTTFTDYAAKRFLEKDADGDGVPDPNSATASEMVTMIARIVLWAFGGIFILSNLGVEVTSLVAGLGIGGIAVAFALQGILSDLFSSFSLYFDKPFRIGDFIVIGEHSGTVEKIGIKTTRIRTLQGEELVVSNAELTTTRVQNFKKMTERRVPVQFGILYETPVDKVRKVLEIVKDIFDNLESARLDRVHFTTYGDSALMYEVIYYVGSSDYTEYLNAQQQFNFALMEEFAKEGIEFAYPTQTLYVKQ